MIKYYINYNPNSEGFNEVHEESCSWLTLMEDPIFIGYFNSVEDAIIRAEEFFTNVCACSSCNLIYSVA